MTFAYGAVLCGWGRGKFRDGAEKKCGDEELEFLCDSNALVLLDNKMWLLSDLLNSEKQAKPTGAKLCYYTVSQEPNGDWTMKQDTSTLTIITLVLFSLVLVVSLFCFHHGWNVLLGIGFGDKV